MNENEFNLVQNLLFNICVFVAKRLKNINSINQMTSVFAHKL